MTFDEAEARRGSSAAKERGHALSAMCSRRLAARQTSITNLVILR